MRSRFQDGWTPVFAILASFAWPGAAQAQLADVIYAGGDIITMDDARPSAEALAVKDGKILAVGSRAEVEKTHKGPGTAMVDLAGKTLVPGFVDGHAHFLGFGSQAVGANLLAPPDGDVASIDDVVEKLKEFARGPDVGRTGWIFGIGYDDALLGRHPNRDDLDKVSKDIPVIAVHISGHFSAMNSAGLAKIGYTAQTPDPEGGVIRRREGSREPNGVLEELASIPHMIPAINARTPEDKDYFLRRGLELAKSFGYTTVNEGRLMAFQQPDLVSAAERGLLDIDVMSYVDYTARDLLDTPWFGREYRNRYRLAGLKITLDGSPQGRTAWRTVPYLIPPDGQQPGYKGYPAIPETQTIVGLLDEAYRKGWPTHVHANGDAAVDQMIEALRAVHGKHPKADRRHTLIHGQFVRKDQLDALKELDVFASLFPMHTFYWGDWYDRIIGPELAQQISPMRSALARGLKVNSHTDAPVALPNLLQVMWATVNRVSRAGKVMGPEERLTPLEALRCITLWGAYEHFEEGRKGSLEVGKLADLVILSDNPLTIDPMRINTIRVLETIKDGRTVYRRSPDAATAGAPAVRRGDGQGGAATTSTLQDFAGQLAGREAPATIYVARSFLTMDPKKPRAEAIAVRDGKFIAVGTRAECEAAAGKGAKIDTTFEGKVVIAGFVEQHVHPVLAALTMNTKVISIEDWDAIDGFSPAVRDEQGYLERLKQALADHKDNKTPFVTWGYHHYFHGAMSREKLNTLAPGVPVIVWHRSAHELFLNDVALKLTGIDEAVVKGLPRSAQEQVSLREGHFFEAGMLALLPKVAPYMASAEQFRKGLEFSKTYYHRNGITLACEPGAFFSKPLQAMINAAYSDDATPFNHYFIGDGKSFFAIKPDDAASLLAETRKVEGWGKGRTAYLPNQVKLFTDGAIYSQLMQMKDGYTDGHHGAWIVDPPAFDFMFQTYWDAGYQIHIHNNGDAGLDVVLGSIEKAMKRKPRTDHRTVLVHFGFAQPEQVRRWGELGGIVSSNPYYVTALAGRYAKLGIGPQRSRNMVPMGDVVKAGMSFSFHSDMPMAPAKPLQLVWAAVNRLTAEGDVAGPDHRVTLDQALNAVTLDAAYSIRMEERVGSIAVGKDANLTVLEQDPYDVEPGKLKDIPVWGTMLEGRLQPVAAATRAAAAPRGGGSGLSDTASDERVRRAVIEQLARLVGHTCAD